MTGIQRKPMHVAVDIAVAAAGPRWHTRRIKDTAAAANVIYPVSGIFIPRSFIHVSYKPHIIRPTMRKVRRVFYSFLPSH